MSHGINANIVHGWRKSARQAATATGSGTVTTFIPVALAPPTVEETGQEQHVCIELHRAGVLVKLAWPLSAVEQLAAWTREFLR